MIVQGVHALSAIVNIALMSEVSIKKKSILYLSVGISQALF